MPEFCTAPKLTPRQWEDAMCEAKAQLARGERMEAEMVEKFICARAFNPHLNRRNRRSCGGRS